MMSKNIVITGTSSGIGLELTKFFIKNKHHVLAISRNNSDLRNLNLKGLYAMILILQIFKNMIC